MSGIIINDHSVRMRPDLPTRIYLAFLVKNVSRIVLIKHPFVWNERMFMASMLEQSLEVYGKTKLLDQILYPSIKIENQSFQSLNKLFRPSLDLVFKMSG